LSVTAKTRSALKQGSAKSGGFAAPHNRPRWPDPNWNNRWPGVVPRYFPINSPVPQRLVPVGAGQWDPAGAKPQPVPAKTRITPKKGVGKVWSDMGIPADFCDDGAGVGRDFEAVQ
ncbi:MAG: hypothetical protein NTV68_06100, partial [Methanomicrobiales archaeon]|nr:hypothetical protein [Methanomicrobiales archaeon]